MKQNDENLYEGERRKKMPAVYFLIIVCFGVLAVVFVPKIFNKENEPEQKEVKKTENASPETTTTNSANNTNDLGSLDSEEENDVFTIAEEMPEYPGGEPARVKFLQDNVNYPPSAQKRGIQGTVYITFIVDEKGDVIKAKVLRGVGGGLDEEALRVVKKMPRWKPGKQAGKNVKVRFNMPIRFTLE